jgi:hypothetical protein
VAEFGVWRLEIGDWRLRCNNQGVSWRPRLAYQGTKLWLLLNTSCSSLTRQLALTVAGRDWCTDHGISTQSNPSVAGIYTTKALAFHLPLFGWFHLPQRVELYRSGLPGLQPYILDSGTDTQYRSRKLDEEAFHKRSS